MNDTLAFERYKGMEDIDIILDILNEYYGINNIDGVLLFAMNSKMYHRLMVLDNKNEARMKRLKRRRKVERRQKRAAFRRRKQGLAVGR